MSEKKGLFGGLFGNKKASDCCNFEIIEEPEESGCGCDCDCGCDIDVAVEAAEESTQSEDH